MGAPVEDETVPEGGPAGPAALSPPKRAPPHSSQKNPDPAGAPQLGQFVCFKGTPLSI